MGGLIPLLLPSTSGNRSSVVNITETKRPASAMSTSTTMTTGHRRQQSLPAAKPMKRFSTPTVAPLPVLPYTSAEWKRTINGIKLKYIGRKYRTCSARCCEILDNLKNDSNVEAIHLVCLHFYAASSFEMCARPLSQSSTYRTKLLSDARDHYDRATILIQKAEETTNQKMRSASLSSTASSSHSPSMSSSSRCSTMDSTLSSPRHSVSSISSVEDLKTLSQPRKPKKKKTVSFSGLPEPIGVAKSWQAEPYVRPDSPTLGWEENSFLFGQHEFGPEQNPPTAAVVHPSPMQAQTMAPKPSTPAVEQAEASLLPKLVPDVEEKDQDLFDLDSFLQTRSKNRICTQLSALRSQISWHRNAVNSILALPEEIPGTPNIPDVLPIPARSDLDHDATTASSSTGSPASDLGSPLTPLSATVSPHTLESALSQRLMDSFGNSLSLNLSSIAAAETGSELWGHSRSASASSTCPPLSRPGSAMSTTSRSGDEALQKRIERLRAGGWQRKRFDTRRYEALREQALGELVA